MSLVFADHLPELASKLEWWYRHAMNIGTRPLRYLELEFFFDDKPHRGAFPDVQYKVSMPGLHVKSRWIPPKPGAEGIRKMCGKWTGDHLCRGNDKILRYCSVERSETLIPFQSVQQVMPKAEDSAHLDVLKPLTNTCTITKLPTEIIQQILAHILPTGHAFQFFVGKKKARHVQKFVLRSPMRDSPTASTDLAVGRTCQRLRDEAHMLFYGGNAFVFHLSTCALRPTTRMNGFKNVRGWSRVIPSQAESAGLGPLTRHAASYLRDVTLVATIPPKQSSTDVLGLTASVQRASAILECSGSLRCLAIDFAEPLEVLTVDGETILAIEALQIVSKNRPVGVIPLPPTEREDVQSRILKPLLDEDFSLKTEYLVAGKLVNDEAKRKLQATFYDRRQKSVSRHTEDEGAKRAAKRQRL